MHNLLVLFLFLSFSLQATPAQVLIIRHGEKPAIGNKLSLKGRERAAALVPFFLGTPQVLEYGTPVAIYAMNAPNADSSLRPIETVQGIAKALNLPLIDNYQHLQYPQMVKEILTNPQYNGKMVLIAWEHHVIPDMAVAFGVKNAPKQWHGDVFDRVWKINFTPTGQIKFYDMPQQLLFGDSPE